MLSPKPKTESYNGRSVAAWLFGMIVWGRNTLYDLCLLRAKKLPGKVISIGNIAVGGTGKSPMVIAVVQELCHRGLSCAVLTRGYKGGLKRGEWVGLLNGEQVAGCMEERVKPDEAVMQSHALPGVPIVAGSQRFRAAHQWLNHCRANKIPLPQVWVLDDGFQHRKLARDLDVVLCDAKEPFGGLLPKGRFREPVESLQRADIVIFTRADDRHPRPGDKSFVTVLSPSIKVGESRALLSAPVLVHPKLGGQGVGSKPIAYFLVAGIAQPKALKEDLVKLGVVVTADFIVGDHEPIAAEVLLEKLRGLDSPILTTAKDWARAGKELSSVGRDVYVVPMTLELPRELSELL